MSKKDRNDLFKRVLDKPGKYWPGQMVNPDEVPDGVLVDDDGYVMGFDDKEASRKYGGKPTSDEKKLNKLVGKYLSDPENWQ